MSTDQEARELSTKDGAPGLGSTELKWYVGGGAALFGGGIAAGLSKQGPRTGFRTAIMYVVGTGLMSTVAGLVIGAGGERSSEEALGKAAFVGAAVGTGALIGVRDEFAGPLAARFVKNGAVGALAIAAGIAGAAMVQQFAQLPDRAKVSNDHAQNS